jgi:hypothetical protein
VILFATSCCPDEINRDLDDEVMSSLFSWACDISSDSAEDFYGNTFCRLPSRRKTLEELSPWEGWQGSPSLAARGTGPCSGLLVLFWWPFSEFSFGVYLRSSPKIKSCPWVFCPLLNI